MSNLDFIKYFVFERQEYDEISPKDTLKNILCLGDKSLNIDGHFLLNQNKPDDQKLFEIDFYRESIIVYFLAHSKYYFRSDTHFNLIGELKLFPEKNYDNNNDFQIVYFMHEEDRCTAYKLYKEALGKLQTNNDINEFLTDLEKLFEYHNVEKRNQMRSELFEAFKENNLAEKLLENCKKANI